MVAVRMVSEGVDVPRLAVGVWATTMSTPLFFAQAVGRFVRARSRGETASVFLPSVPHLLELRLRHGGAARPRAGPPGQRRGRHLRRRGGPARRGQRRGRPRPASSRCPGRPWDPRRRSTTCSTTAREFGHSGEVMVGSEEEMDFLGIPGLLEPDQVRELLHSRQSERARKQKADGRRRPRRRLGAGAQHAPAARRAPARAQRPRRRLAPPDRSGRTASPTTRSARSAAARRRPSPAPSSCTSGSTGSASGPCGRPPEPAPLP